MADDGAMSRRRFLITAGLLGGAAAVGVLYTYLDEDGSEAEAVLLTFSGPLASSEAVIRLGEAYLEEHEPGIDADRLTELLFAELAAPGADPDGMRGRFDDRIAEEFETGETVRVRGWILSRTESRLCAWIALQNVPA